MYVIHFTGELFIRDFTSLIFKPSTPHYYYVAHHVTLFIQWAPCTLTSRKWTLPRIHSITVHATYVVLRRPSRYTFHSMGLFLYREILCYPTPINFNYWYGIGLLLVFLLVNQVLTGIQVGSYYIVSIDVALSSVDYLMREITYGWSFRYLHSNGAYWIFTLVYVHLWRGI